MAGPDPDKIIRYLWRSAEQRETSQIYAILDAARNEKIYPAMMNFDGESCCLFGEGIPEVLAKASPYLLRLEPESEFTSWLMSEGWGDSWGIFLESGATLEELRRHFRGLIRVKDEEGKEFFFRYYDPRVLRDYVAVCDENEADIFFGPVKSFRLEGEDANTLLVCSRGDSGPTCETFDLS